MRGCSSASLFFNRPLAKVNTKTLRCGSMCHHLLRRKAQERRNGRDLYANTPHVSAMNAWITLCLILARQCSEKLNTALTALLRSAACYRSLSRRGG